MNEQQTKNRMAQYETQLKAMEVKFQELEEMVALGCRDRQTLWLAGRGLLRRMEKLEAKLELLPKPKVRKGPKFPYLPAPLNKRREARF